MADIRTQLLDAARDVLREKGIMGATTRGIARAAGLADGTLYNHFRTREDLFLALFERMVPLIRESLQDLPLRVGKHEVTANLEQVLVAALEFFRETVPLFAAIISDPALNEGYRAQLGTQNRGPHRAYQSFEAYLAAEQRLGRVASGVDAATTAQQLVAIAFFQAFTERFLATKVTAASDKRWAAAQVKALAASWTPDH